MTSICLFFSVFLDGLKPKEELLAAVCEDVCEEIERISGEFLQIHYIFFFKIQYVWSCCTNINKLFTIFADVMSTNLKQTINQKLNKSLTKTNEAMFYQIYVLNQIKSSSKSAVNSIYTLM